MSNPQSRVGPRPQGMSKPGAGQCHCRPPSVTCERLGLAGEPLMAGKMNYPTHGKGRKDDASWAASRVHWDMGRHSLRGGGETPSLQILGAHLADVRLQAALTLSVWSRRMRRGLQRSLLAEGMRSSRGGAWNECGGGEQEWMCCFLALGSLQRSV